MWEALAPRCQAVAALLLHPQQVACHPPLSCWASVSLLGWLAAEEKPAAAVMPAAERRGELLLLGCQAAHLLQVLQSSPVQQVQAPRAPPAQHTLLAALPLLDQQRG